MSYYFGYVARCIAYRQARGKWAAASYDPLNCTQARSIKANRFHPPPNYACTVGCGMGRGPGGSGGGGVFNKCFYREAPLLLARSNPLPFYIPFFTKKVQCTSFVYLLLTNGTPLYIPCLELCTPFNCCKCTVF